MTDTSTSLGVATFPFITEEIATLLFLTGGPGSVAINGVEACASSEDGSFDVGLRALLSKDLVRIDDSGVRLAEVCEEIARCVAEPDVAGLLVVTTDGAHDVASFGQASRGTAVVRGMAAGAFQVAYWTGGAVDAVMAIADQLRNDGRESEWSSGIRVHVLGGDTVDFVVGAGRTGVVVDNLPVESDEATVRGQLEIALARG